MKTTHTLLFLVLANVTFVHSSISESNSKFYLISGAVFIVLAILNQLRKHD